MQVSDSSLPARPGDNASTPAKPLVRPEARSSAATGPNGSRHASPALPNRPGTSTPSRQPSSASIPPRPDSLKAERESAQQSRFQNLSAPVPPSGPSSSRPATRNVPPTNGSATPVDNTKRRPVTPPLPDDDAKVDAERRPESRASIRANDQTPKRESSAAEKRPPTPELPDVEKATLDRRGDDRAKARDEQLTRDARGPRADSRSRDDRDRRSDRDDRDDPRKRKRDDEVSYQIRKVMAG